MSREAYTDGNNPFGDVNLHAEFRWKAREDKLKKQGLNVDDINKDQECLRAEELRQEIAKLKQRRQQRDEEKARWEEARSRFSDGGSGLPTEIDEDKFQLLQLKRRALIRLQEGRPKHIDWLILIYLHAAGANALAKVEGSSHAQHESMILPRLPADAISPLKVLDMLAQPDISSNQSNQFQSYQQLLSHQHRKPGAPEAPGSSQASGNNAVDLALEQFRKLKSDIQLFIALEDSQLEVRPQARDYWRALLALVNFKLGVLEKCKDSAQSFQPAMLDIPSDDTSSMFVNKSYSELQELEAQAKEAMNAPGAIIDDEYWHNCLSILSLWKAAARLIEVFNIAMQEAGKLEPTPLLRIEPSPVEPADGNLPAPKRRKLEESNQDDSIIMSEAQNDLGQGEEVFDLEVTVPQRHAGWMDKYRPRKPKYFNRVKTGYEWNKYNQTHYDIDNPPPKIVQGYKFNIFYPDLIDKSKAPQYFLEKSDSPDFVILRFHAGPPYEDIAFKIVNKEWEYSQKRGFKCMYSNGILYLWFNFKRYRYRR